jgi:predicted amidohydrolase
VVLPELYCFDGGVVPATMTAQDAAHRAHVAVATLTDAVHGTDALVVTSLPGELGEAVSHDAVLIGADGVLARQPQLHRVERHAHWVGALGDSLAVHETPFGRLALVVGDDSIYPETFRLAALADADVVALPFSALEAWETGTGLVERSGENRLVLVAASRPGPAGASLVCDLPHDFTLWSAHWSAPFAGVISHPDVVRAAAEPGVTHVVVHPAEAVNRFVSRGTDLVDGRPWALLGATVLAR